MTEIPMPGDYGSTQPPQPAQRKGCCQRICECWLYLLCFAILVIVILVLLGIYGPLYGLFGMLP